jgi:hypothetical protein
VTIRTQRRDIARLFQKAPSLKSADAEEFAAAYETARGEAMKETGLDLEAFPVEPPFTSEQARDAEFWPGPIRQD